VVTRRHPSRARPRGQRRHSVIGTGRLTGAPAAAVLNGTFIQGFELDDGIRFLKASLGNYGYAGPRPIPGHGPHHYRFHLLAIDKPVSDAVATSKALLAETAGHLLGRGVLTGTYERF
jgi:phosphatidylethanolamine-binding protein (PEBP) family uncharacterized protein